MSRQYEDFLRHVYENGVAKTDRTGTGTRSVFGYQMRFDLTKGFPAVTTKRVAFKAVVAELLWFLSGSTNNNDLRAMGCTIWDEWAREDGDLGPIYGKQWRSWISHDSSGNATTYDQISEAIHLLKTDPDSRRILVSAWNVADLDQMALMPCHALFQFYTRELSRQERINLHVKQVASGEFVKTGTTEGMDEHLDAQGVPRRALSCQLYQRSADLFLGVPFNIASYALLTHMMAQQCNMVVGDFVWTGGDCHIYSNHFAQVEEQLSRQPYSYPTLAVARCPEDIFSYRPEDFQLVGYAHHPAISAPVAV